jgi:L-ascorbate metabolism protein UlaG (beta-lactamase superfamily)
MGGSRGELKLYVEKHLSWFGQSAFRLRVESGEVIFIDPFGVDASAGPADMILITHPHFDHFDRRSVSALQKPSIAIVVPQSVAEPHQEGISAGQTLRIGDITVTAIPAYNSSKPFHARAKGWVGYLIEADGIRLYHAGDTDFIPEMRGLAPDVALLPVGGLFTMGWRAAAEAVAALPASLAIPMHFGGLLFWVKEAGEKFVRMAGPAGMILPRSR